MTSHYYLAITGSWAVDRCQVKQIPIRMATLQAVVVLAVVLGAMALPEVLILPCHPTLP